MSDNWFYRTGDTETGPCTLVEISRLVHAGDLARTDKVRHVDGENWVPVESVLQQLLQATQASELSDLSELNITFVDTHSSSNSDGNGADAPLAELDDLSDFQIVSEDRKPDEAKATGAAAKLSELLEDLDSLNIQIVSESPAAERATDSSSESAATDESSTAEGWYYERLGQELGPMPVEALVRLAEEGMLGSTDKVRSADGEWMSASDVPEIATTLMLRVAPTAEAEPEPPADDTSETKSNRRRRQKRKTEDPKKHDEPVDEHQPSTAEAEPSEEAPVAGEDQKPVEGESEAEPETRPGESDAKQDTLNAEPDTQSEDEVEPEPAADRWFCRIDGVEHGPLTFAELTSMATRGRLKRPHEIREGDEGDWIAADLKPDLFVNEPPPPAPVEVAPSAAVSSPAKPAPQPAPKQSKPPKTRRKSTGGGSGISVVELLKENKVLVIGGAVVLVICGVILAIGLGLFRPSDEEYYRELNDIWKQHKELRARKAPASEWDPLVARAVVLQKTIKKDLYTRATAEQPELQAVLWASDHLLPMLRKCKKEVGKDEEMFAKYMKDAAPKLEKPDN